MNGEVGYLLLEDREQTGYTATVRP